MLTSTLDALDLAPEFPDLLGRRVLVTGVSGPMGLEVARMLAEQRTRLVLLAPGAGHEIDALGEIVSPLALDLRMFTGPFDSSDAAVRALRSSMQSFAGIDALVNLAHLVEPDDGSAASVEHAVARTLSLPMMATRIAVNRMRTTMNAGAIANVLVVPRDARGRRSTVASIARAALATLTRREAEDCRDAGIRINAVAPEAASIVPALAHSRLSSAADVASLALQLVSERGSKLSGLTFDGAGV